MSKLITKADAEGVDSCVDYITSRLHLPSPSSQQQNKDQWMRRHSVDPINPIIDADLLQSKVENRMGRFLDIVASRSHLQKSPKSPLLSVEESSFIALPVSENEVTYLEENSEGEAMEGHQPALLVNVNLSEKDGDSSLHEPNPAVESAQRVQREDSMRPGDFAEPAQQVNQSTQLVNSLQSTKPIIPPTQVTQPINQSINPPTRVTQPINQSINPPTQVTQPIPLTNPPTQVIQPIPLTNPPAQVTQPIPPTNSSIHPIPPTRRTLPALHSTQPPRPQQPPRHSQPATRTATKRFRPPPSIDLSSVQSVVRQQRQAPPPRDLRFVEYVGPRRVVAGAVIHPRYLEGVDAKGRVVVPAIQVRSLPAYSLRAKKVKQNDAAMEEEEPSIERRLVFSEHEDDGAIVARALHGLQTTEQLERQLDAFLFHSSLSCNKQVLWIILI